MPKTIGDTTAAAKPLDKALPPGQKKKYLGYVTELSTHIDGLLAVYRQARPEARLQLRAHSPVLDAVLSLLESNGVVV
jgi:hypothetical protein